MPKIGGVLQLRGDPLARIVALRARYGGIVRLGPLGNAEMFLITDPAAVRHVLVDHHTNYKKGFASGRLRPVLGQGSLLLEGAVWRRRRRLIQPAFHKQKVASLAAVFIDGTDAMLARWRPSIDAGVAVDARDEMLRLTMGFTLENMFRGDATSLAPLVGAWETLYDELSRGRLRLVRLPSWIPDRHRDRTTAAIATVHRVLGELIRKRRASEDDGSVLDMLVRARDDEDGTGLSEQELRDEVMTIFVGGYETSSNALAFAVALLAAHPGAAATQREEVDRILGDRAPGAADLTQLPYTRAVLEEAMRLYPPSWSITREAVADDVVCGYRIAAGSQLVISSYGVHHAPEIWPDPERFRPDRFLPGGPERPRFSFFPFGGGPRVCLGDQYAFTEMQLVLARLGQKVTLRLADGCKIAARAHVGLRPRDPLRILARWR